MIQMRINGGKQLHDLLQQLPVEVETKILREAMGRAANVLRQEAKARVPIETGMLEDTIKSTRDTKKGLIIAKVKLDGYYAFVGVFMEYGVLPHVISARRSKVLRIKGKSAGKSINHPGHASRPFLRPTLDENGPRVLQIITDYLTKYLAFGTIEVPQVSVDLEEAA